MSNFSFPNATQAAPAFSFSSPTPSLATTAPTFNFGTSSIGAGMGTIGGPATSLNFGTTTSSSSGAPTFNFGSGQTPSMGIAPQPTATITTPSLGIGQSAPVPGTNFNFGSTQTLANVATSQPRLGGGSNIGGGNPFSFGSGTSTGLTSTATTSNFTLGTLTTCTQQSGAASTTTATTSTATPFVGLGGTGPITSQQRSEQKNDIAVKENKVPLEILKNVDELKLYIKQQKTISSEIARTSARKIANVSNGINGINNELEEVANSIHNTYGQIKNLRKETSKAIHNVEMAKQTSETPPQLQHENLEPLRYFQEIVQKYENDLYLLRNQIELTENQMKSSTYSQQLTPEDLKRGLKQTHECFVALSGRLHELHRRVENVKEQYLKLPGSNPNEFLDIENDNDNINVDELQDISKIGCGPSPFSTLAGISIGLGRYTLNNRNANQSGGSGFQSTLITSSTGATGAGTDGGSGLNLIGTSNLTGLGYGGGGVSGTTGNTNLLFGVNNLKSTSNQTTFGTSAFPAFGTSLTSSPLLSTTGEGLNLQKPPIGEKRRKV